MLDKRMKKEDAMTFKELVADIKYRKSLRLVIGDLRYMHERKVFEKGFSFFMVLKLCLLLLRRKINITGIALKGSDIRYNLLVENTYVRFVSKKQSFKYENGICVEQAPEIKDNNFLHFKSVLKELDGK